MTGFNPPSPPKASLVSPFPASAPQEAADWLRSRLPGSPVAGIILGTGLGGLLGRVEAEIEIPYTSIPHFPQPTVESHSGRLVLGRLRGRRVLCFSGRFHLYEGYSLGQIVLPVRVSRLLGARALLISNAAGGISPRLKRGSLMRIEDHLNLLPGNPLIGPNDDRLGPRFPDMSRPYDPEFSRILAEVADEAGINLQTGVYASVPGPMLETRAEYRALRILGADAVGMSTVPEVIAAVHCGLRVGAISVITDECDPDNLSPVAIAEILAAAAAAEPALCDLFAGLVSRL